MTEPTLIQTKSMLPIDQIEVSDRLRPVSAAGVATIVASVRELGQLANPVVVRQLRRKGATIWRVVDGAHRLEALRELGWTEVPVRVFECSDDQARIMEIDGNLSGAELNPLDTAVFLATRKAVYERLHPETKAGVAGALHKNGATDTMSVAFVTATAEKFSLSDRHVRRMIAAGAKLGPNEVARLRTAPRQVTLKDLQDISRIANPADRYGVVDALVAGNAKSASAALKARQTPTETRDEKPVRPQVVAFQDLYSGKMLSWRVDLDPNKVAVMSAFGELVETFGIPRHCLFDNGREFANKWLTGGAPTRFRFKVRTDDPLGVLPMLGVKLHWATPGHGQAKPIERGFRDFADRIAKDPRFVGAYVGNRPDAKPEDYGSRAVPLEEFLRVLEEGIQQHNARQGRLSENAKGRSFDDTFAESYARAPIRKATAEQHRLWLMGQEVRKLHRDHGGLMLFKNGYWADWMNEHAGRRVVARFDPENLHAGVFIYTPEGEFLGQAECREKVGFFDMVGAKVHQRQQRLRRKAEKQLLDAMRPIGVQQLADEMDATPRPDTPLVEARVVELAPARRAKPLFERELPVPDVDEALEERRTAVMLSFRQAEEAPADPVETPEDRFRRAIDILGRAEAGLTVGSAEADWVRIYQNTPEFTRQQMMFEDFGDEGLA